MTVALGTLSLSLFKLNAAPRVQGYVVRGSVSSWGGMRGVRTGGLSGGAICLSRDMHVWVADPSCISTIGADVTMMVGVCGRVFQGCVL